MLVHLRQLEQLEDALLLALVAQLEQGAVAPVLAGLVLRHGQDLLADPAVGDQLLDLLAPLLRGHDGLLELLDHLALLHAGLGEHVLPTGVGQLRQELGGDGHLLDHRLVDGDLEGVLPALASGDPAVTLHVHLAGVLGVAVDEPIHLAGGTVSQG